MIHYKVFDNSKREIVVFRNIITHHYFGIDEDIVWDIVTSHLRDLKHEILHEIDKLENKNQLFDLFMQEYKMIAFQYEKLKELQ